MKTSEEYLNPLIQKELSGLDDLDYFILCELIKQVQKDTMKKKLKCYYAHCMITYDSLIEYEDVELLEKLGFEVINPNCEEHKEGCNKYSKLYGKDKVMKYFENIVEDCDMIAFRALPDGSIPSGVAAEVKYAMELNHPIIELPCSIIKRCQEYPETKQYLKEIGLYKVNNGRS